MPGEERTVVTRGLAVLFAVGGGLAVGNLYYAQPLLDEIARDLRVSSGAAGLLITTTQVGYAVGIFLLVPLGDLLDRRRLIPVVMAVSAIALAVCAVAPGFGVLAGASAAVGLTTVAGQLITPLTGDLAEPAERGRLVGIVASGLITGIIVVRTVSGLGGGLLGWRTIYVVAAVATAVLAIVLHARIPHLPPKTREPYGRLLASVVRLVRTERTLQASMLLGGLAFAVFTMFWTGLTFLLSAPPYSLPATVIGVFGLAGLQGTDAAHGAGRLHDRRHRVPVTGAAWTVVVIAWVVALVGQSVLAVVIAAVVVLDLGVQAQNILNQNRIFALSGEARSRRNTGYGAGNFVIGLIGSLLASVLWDTTRWTGIAIAGAVLSLAALGVWAGTRRGALLVR